MSATFVEGDTGSKLRVTCIDNDTRLAIPLAGKTVRLRWDSGSRMVERTMSVVDAPNGMAEYQFAAGELVSGLMQFEVEIQDGSGNVISSLSLLREQVRRQLG
jgi:hypothetical protein